MYTNNIPGWMDPKELDWLYTQARKMDSIIEIGSWRGRSTHALLSGCKGLVTAVDTFKEIGVFPTGFVRQNDPYTDFMKHVGHFINLRVFRMPSDKALEMLSPWTDVADMIFIDSSHKYLDTCHDLIMWLPLTRRLICGHDYTNPNEPGVKKAVDELFGSRVKVFESIWYVELAGEETSY